MTPSTVNVTEIATRWLSGFADAFSPMDAAAIADCFLPDGWLRDTLIITWNFRSLQGQEKIKAYVQDNTPGKHIRNLQIDTRVGLLPEAKDNEVVTGFTFETDSMWGHGYVHLVQVAEGSWKALCCSLMADNIKGHEEMTMEEGSYSGLAWEDVLSQRRKKIEQDPHVVVVGGGHTGLTVAARFKQMNIPALLVETNARIGDNWRDRYPTLTLHTVRSHHPLLYAPFPSNWPLFTPKEKLADWMEQYAITQDLTIWLNSRPLNTPLPSYDTKTRRWTITIDHNGEPVTLHPAHIILATGAVGAPFTPTVKNAENFTGTIIHSVQFKGASEFSGKRIVVVGAGNTGADICQTLAYHEATEVTMVQRSSTLVTPIDAARKLQELVWPEPHIVPTEISDFKVSSVPLNLFRKIARQLRLGGGGHEGPYAEMYKALEAKGLIAHDGEGHEGNYFRLLERFGGFWVDVGCAASIISGQVKVKHGVEIAEMKPDAVVFTDGSELPVDVVIFATGYHTIRETMTSVFGKDIIEKAGPVWGIDEEGEIRGCYKLTGQPGFWYAVGDFYLARFMSKLLAIQIKATELGLMPQ